MQRRVMVLGVLAAGWAWSIGATSVEPPTSRESVRTTPPHAGPGSDAGDASGASAQSSAPTSATAQRAHDPFTPSVHGFRFVNSFTGSSMPPELRDAESGVLAWARGMAERYVDLPERYGLCGGMSLLAADYYLAGVDVPGEGAAPESGTALYDAIYARQRDSLGVGSACVFKFSRWMSLPDVTPPSSMSEESREVSHEQGVESAATAEAGADGGWPTSTSAGTRGELPSICADLEAGNLVPLGLVLTRAGRGRLWNNHQVLAYALTRVDEATLEIHIYDPNFPGDDGVVLRVEGIGVGALGLNESSEEARTLWHDGAAGTSADAATGDPPPNGEMVRTTRLTTSGRLTNVRGVFRMPYEPRVPGEGGGRGAARSAG